MDVMALPLFPHQTSLTFNIGSFCVLDFRLSAKPLGRAGKECRLGGRGHEWLGGEVAVAGAFFRPASGELEKTSQPVLPLVASVGGGDCPTFQD